MHSLLFTHSVISWLQWFVNSVWDVAWKNLHSGFQTLISSLKFVRSTPAGLKLLNSLFRQGPRDNSISDWISRLFLDSCLLLPLLFFLLFKHFIISHSDYTDYYMHNQVRLSLSETLLTHFCPVKLVWCGKVSCLFMGAHIWCAHLLIRDWKYRFRLCEWLVFWTRTSLFLKGSRASVNTESNHAVSRYLSGLSNSLCAFADCLFLIMKLHEVHASLHMTHEWICSERRRHQILQLWRTWFTHTKFVVPFFFFSRYKNKPGFVLMSYSFCLEFLPLHKQ